MKTECFRSVRVIFVNLVNTFRVCFFSKSGGNDLRIAGKKNLLFLYSKK